MVVNASNVQDLHAKMLHKRLYIIFSEPTEKTGDRKKDLELMMTKVNETLEDWIIERPDQWFWLHNRWPNNQDYMN